MSFLDGIKKNSPLLLSIAGVAGLITTMIFTYKDAPKAKAALEKQEEESVYEPTIVEKAMVVAPICWKEIVAGSATAFCILFSNYISRKQQAALFGAAMLSSQMLEKFKKQLNPEQLEEVEKKIAEESYETKVKKDGMIVPSLVTGNPDLDAITDRLFYDNYTGEWFYSSEYVVKDRLYQFQRSFAIDSKAGVNDYCEIMGIPQKEEYQMYGFNSWMFLDNGSMPWIDFVLKDEHFTNDEGELIRYTVIYMDEPPIFDYARYGK